MATATTPSDAIVVGSDWISEHYFTTDATKDSFKAQVLTRRKEWDADKEAGTPRTRFAAARSELLSRFATLADADTREIRELNEAVAEVLGYHRAGLLPKPEGPVTFIHAAGLDQPCIALVDARPAEAVEELLAKDAETLTEPFEVDEGTTIGSVPRLLSHLFVTDERRPAFALVLAGAHALVAERERWPEGRYLAIDLQLVAERNDDKKGGEVDRALACLSADSLAPDAEGTIWWTGVLEESVKHTVGVSQDLREGVRLSIEIIANEVVTRRRAQGLDPLPQFEAQPLARQSLRFLYRILFLLYAEASPELQVLPVGAPEYERGYSLDRMRELVQVRLTSPRSRNGRHLYDSLAVLFTLVDRGHNPPTDGEVIEGLTFRGLRADLFKPEATAHIDEVGLGNHAVQEVLQHLLLSKKQKGKDRGFISYAELGINQLGAVYEGLMSYTGFFAETDLFEVAKDGNAEKGSWVVPVDRAEGIAEKDFVMVEDEDTGERKPVRHARGTFVFRLAGRERQQSASYYTPEVLTRFVVSQALAELLDQDGHTTTADEVLDLTICEPALGSGAFAIEAVRQLGEEYLTRRQSELGRTIDPEDYPKELQRVKAHLALHRVHGVDLNATAVELAEISLWLDTMTGELQAPWFGLHLRRGNSLVGARKAVFSRRQVTDRSWLKAVPKPVGRGEDHVERLDGRVPHFLLPAEGWGSAAEVGKDIKELVPDAVRDLKAWRKTVRAKPTKKQVDGLVEMGRRVERLWEIATRRLQIAEQQIRRDIPLWGRDVQPSQPDGRHITREEIESSLTDSDGAYQRLRRVMDAWCALWFWPLTDTEVEPPTLEQWYDALHRILGGDTTRRVLAKKGHETFDAIADWDTLDEAETNDRIYAGAKRLDDVLGAHPWLRVCQQIATEQGFFHWELDFAPVFEVGGFNLQLGNPPWVRPDWDERAALAEYDVRFALEGKMPADRAHRLRAGALEVAEHRAEFVELGEAQVALREFVSAPQLYPYLAGLRPDLYRCFMERTWAHVADAGVTGLVHPETHFTDERAGLLRAGAYRRLRRHWQFVNELVLFDIDHHVSYGTHVYGASSEHPFFVMASSLYHPDTAERSLEHDGTGSEPGLKDPDGNWDLRPHRSRILDVDAGTLAIWHALLEDGATPILQSRMVYTVNTSSAGVLDKLSRQDRLASLGMEFSQGWNETTDFKKGYFGIEWGEPDSWRDVILRGPHIHVADPFYKAPNATMANNLDWSEVDLEALPPDAIPVTAYKPRGDRSRYDADYTHWGEDRSIPARDLYRLAWRRMAANTGERTLIPTLIPPGAAHVDGVQSGGGVDNVSLTAIAGVLASLISDFSIRVVPKGDIRSGSIERLALPTSSLHPELLLRTLRLNCLTSAYESLWHDALSEVAESDVWTGGIDYVKRPALGDVTSTWTPASPLRRASDRRQALLEVDVIVALSLGLTADELCTIYRTQFPVLYGYDRNTYFYDANGRLVPNSVLSVWKKKGLSQSDTDGMTEEERTATNAAGNTYVYQLPFVTLDREADMRQAYAHFEKVLAERQAEGGADG